MEAPAVMSLGRTRPRLASRRASSKGVPWAMRPLAWVMSTRLFCTATPSRPIIPTRELMFQVSPASQRAKRAPAKASGRVATTTSTSRHRRSAR